MWFTLYQRLVLTVLWVLCFHAVKTDVRERFVPDSVGLAVQEATEQRVFSFGASSVSAGCTHRREDTCTVSASHWRDSVYLRPTLLSEVWPGLSHDALWCPSKPEQLLGDLVLDSPQVRVSAGAYAPLIPS